MSDAHSMMCGNYAMYLMVDWMEDYIKFSKSTITSPENSKMFDAIGDKRAKTNF